MWPFGRKRREEAIRKDERKQIEAKTEAKRKHEESIAVEVKQIREREEKRKAKYFALPKYPSNRSCWACGDDSPFESKKVELVRDTVNFYPHEYSGCTAYGDRRFLVVTCPRCNAVFHERMQNARVYESEIEPESEGE